MKVYKVPQQHDSYFVGNGYYSYLGSELRIDTVECSNKLVLLDSDFYTAVYIDLENGNIVSGYRPGGQAFLLGNVIEFYSSKNYCLEKSNMIYWIEAYCAGEYGLHNLGSRMAENPDSSTVMSKVLLKDASLMDREFSNYVNECVIFNGVLRDTFIGRKSRNAELNMISYDDKSKLRANVDAYFFSYLRARNKDFMMLYCREDDAYYVKLANKYGIGSFKTKDNLVKSLRSIGYVPNSELTGMLRGKDSTDCAQLHDFMLDLEKIGQVLNKIL